jgi:hypothetical protein
MAYTLFPEVRNLPSKRYTDAMRAFREQAPKILTRTREYTADTFLAKTVYSKGPIRAILTPFKLDPATQTYDEKGSTVELKFLLVVIDDPPMLEEVTGLLWPLFQIGDLLTDGTNQWRVSSHQYTEDKVTQVVVTLLSPEAVPIV